MTARDPSLRPTALEVAVMARELAPQLVELGAGAGAATESTVAFEVQSTVPLAAADADADAALVGDGADAAAATRVLPAASRRAPGSPRSDSRRRGVIAGAIAAGAALVVVSALALGSLMAPGSESQTVPNTPRPTPSVQAPPATVAPAVSPTTEQPAPTVAPQEPVQQAPAQQAPAKPAPGGGPGNGNGNGKDKGGPPAKGKDKGKP